MPNQPPNNQHAEKMRTLIIIPAYNEAGHIGRVIQELRSTCPSFDLLVINDNSSDATFTQAKAEGAHVVSLPYNLGIGGAMQTGFQYARSHGYAFAVQLDGDGQHDPRYIRDILTPLYNQDYNLCIGSRFLDTKGFQSSLLRRLGIRFFSWLISNLSGQHTSDPTSGFRAADQRAIALFAGDYPVDFPEPESIVIAKRAGCRIGEVPVIMRNRFGGHSSIRFLKSGYYMLKVTIAIILCVLRKKEVK